MTAGSLRFRLLVAAVLAVLSACAPAAAADEPDLPPVAETLVLKNGDRVAGKSLDIRNGMLRWQMPYGGELTIPLALVERIDLHRPRNAAPADQATEAPPAEPPKPPEPQPDPTPEAKSDAAVEPAAAQVPAVVAEPLPLSTAWYEAGRSTYTFTTDTTSKWVKRFELGGTWVSGNSETSEAYIGGVFERQFDQIFHQLDWNGRHATAGDRVTQSRWQFNGTTDFSKKADSKWILFATHRHLFDELADVNYRGTYASGIGYRFFNEGDRRLITRLGPGLTWEKFDPPIGSRLTPDLFAEAEARWPIFDRTLVEYKGTVTPSLDEIGVFRATSNYGLLVKLDSMERWAMRVGLRHDHNSQPNPGRKEDDFTTTFSMVYTRK